MIYILDLLEFQVLAAARNMDVYYGFFREEAAREEIYYTVYQMVRSGVLKQEKEELLIQPPFSDFMDRIAGSPGVLVADRGQYVLPRQCIYFAEGQYVCVENCRQEKSEVSLCGMTEEDLFAQLQELNQLPSPRLTQDLGSFDYAGYWDSHISEELKEKLLSGCQEETEEYLKCEQVHSVFTMRDKKNGKIYRRMILLDLALEYCMILQDVKSGKSLSRERYTQENAWELLKSWWQEDNGRKG